MKRKTEKNWNVKKRPNAKINKKIAILSFEELSIAFSLLPKLW
jgi:hypothetical protein